MNKEIEIKNKMISLQDLDIEQGIVRRRKDSYI
jgi:hypothetical protein